MANTPMGGCFATPRQEYIHGFRPGDCFMEMVDATCSSNTLTITMGTTNSFLTHASWAYAVNRVNGGAKSVSSGGTIQNLGTSFAVKGDDELHDLYIVGGIGHAPIHFSMAATANAHFPHTVYWELQKLTMSSGSLKVTSATDLDYIDRAIYVLPVQVVSAAPETGGAYVSELSTVDFTVVCGSGTATVFALVGGYIESDAPTDNATDIDIDLREKKPVYLGNAYHHAPGDLVGEIVWKNFTSASPSTATITAASDCQFIKHIIAVLPEINDDTALCAGWSGTQGASSVIYTANSKTVLVGSLVLGIY